MKTIYDLKLHEEIQGTSFNSWAIRVPGGWIYTVKSNSVFVPFNNEYQQSGESELPSAVDQIRPITAGD